MESTTFDHLPDFLIRQIALPLPLSGVNSLCTTNKRFEKAISLYNIFWYDKLVLDYEIIEKFSELFNWKKIYRSRLIGLGNNFYRQLGLKTINAKELTYIPTVPFKDVACGDHNTIIIDINNDLWGTGDNIDGQLGVRSTSIHQFIKIPNEAKFIQVACGSSHTLALSDDNRIWVTGSNYYGELGLDLDGGINQFTEVEGYRAKQISCSGNHSAFIDLDGNLHTFGDGRYGQLGRDGDNKFPDKVSINVPIIQVACGRDHTVCIDDNNDIWVFGSNWYGQLGLMQDENSQRKHPVKIPNHKAKYVSCGFKQTAFIDLNDNAWIFGIQSYEKGRFPIKVMQGQIVDIDFKVKQVYCGSQIILFIDLEDNLWATGENETLNIKSEIPVIISRAKTYKVAAGKSHMVVMG